MSDAPTPADPIVRIQHIRAVPYCARGARQWFDQHGFSWSEFLEHGLPASKLEATGDGLILRVTAIARRENA